VIAVTWKHHRHKSRRFFRPRLERLEVRELLSAAPLLHVSSDGLHLLDANDEPFYMIGDTAWTTPISFSEDEATYYFQQRAAQGFNAVQMDAVGLTTIPTASPADFNGNVPFNGFLPGTSIYDVSTTPAAGDVTSSAGKYWQRLDSIIGLASANGIVVVLDIYDTYCPWFHTDFLDGDSPSSTEKLLAYGQFLGQRYGDDDNIIWMIGNDYNLSPEGDADIAAVLQGIRQFDDTHLITMQMASYAQDPPAAFDNQNLRQYMTLNGIYLYSTGPYRTTYLEQYNRTDVGPTFNIETGYEYSTHLNVTTDKLRSGHYSFLLNGASGDLYGSERVGGRVGGPFDDEWQAAVNSPGAQEFTYFANLLETVAWYNLVPDQNGTVFQGVGDPTDYSGARSLDGTLAIAYKPPSGGGGQSFTVHMNQFAGPVTAQWYDPTNGTYFNIGSALANSGDQVFTSPAANSAGQNDFVLVLKTAVSVPSVPGGLTATGENSQVALSWNAVNGATSYNLYRATTTGAQGSTPYRTGITAAEFIDIGVTNGARYYYRVSAVNDAEESGTSSEVSAATLIGDYNHSGTVDAADYTTWRNAMGSSVTAFSGADGDGDGTINHGDYAVWKAEFGQTMLLSGDYNLDGVVNAADYTTWRNSLGNSVAEFSGADGDGNGVVNEGDYGVWKTHFGQTLASLAQGNGAAADSNGSSILDAGPALGVRDVLEPLIASEIFEDATNARVNANVSQILKDRAVDLAFSDYHAPMRFQTGAAFRMAAAKPIRRLGGDTRDINLLIAGTPRADGDLLSDGPASRAAAIIPVRSTERESDFSGELFAAAMVDETIAGKQLGQRRLYLRLLK
jgi:hypothetical protein